MWKNMCFYVFRIRESCKLFTTFFGSPEISSLEIEPNILEIEPNNPEY